MRVRVRVRAGARVHVAGTHLLVHATQQQAQGLARAATEAICIEAPPLLQVRVRARVGVGARGLGLGLASPNSSPTAPAGSAHSTHSYPAAAVAP